MSYQQPCTNEGLRNGYQAPVFTGIQRCEIQLQSENDLQQESAF
jgi:hypothetical protein